MAKSEKEFRFPPELTRGVDRLLVLRRFCRSEQMAGLTSAEWALLTVATTLDAKGNPPSHATIRANSFHRVIPDNFPVRIIESLCDSRLITALQTALELTDDQKEKLSESDNKVRDFLLLCISEGKPLKKSKSGILVGSRRTPTQDEEISNDPIHLLSLDAVVTGAGVKMRDVTGFLFYKLQAIKPGGLYYQKSEDERVAAVITSRKNAVASGRTSDSSEFVPSLETIYKKCAKTEEGVKLWDKWHEKLAPKSEDLEAIVKNILRYHLDGSGESQVALDLIVNNFLPNVINDALKFQDRGVPLADLVQEGVEGLLIAINKYDLRLGTTFSSSSFSQICASMRLYIANYSTLIRVPYRTRQQCIELTLVEQEILAEGNFTNLKSKDAIREIAARMGVKPLALNRIESARHALSNSKISRLKDALDVPENDDALDFLEELIVSTQMRDKIIKFLESREMRDKDSKIKIFKYRYGLEDDTEHTLKDTGIKFNKSKEGIRQILIILARMIKVHFGKEIKLDY